MSVLVNGNKIAEEKKNLKIGSIARKKKIYETKLSKSFTGTEEEKESSKGKEETDLSVLAIENKTAAKQDEGRKQCKKTKYT